MGETRLNSGRGFVGKMKGLIVSRGFHLLGGLVAACVVLLLLRWMASEVFEGETAVFDEAVRQAHHQVANPFLTQTFVGVSFVGSPVFLAGLGITIVGLLIYFGRKRA